MRDVMLVGALLWAWYKRQDWYAGAPRPCHSWLWNDTTLHHAGSSGSCGIMVGGLAQLGWSAVHGRHDDFVDGSGVTQHCFELDLTVFEGAWRRSWHSWAGLPCMGDRIIVLMDLT